MVSLVLYSDVLVGSGRQIARLQASTLTNKKDKMEAKRGTELVDSQARSQVHYSNSEEASVVLVFIDC